MTNVRLRSIISKKIREDKIFSTVINLIQDSFIYLIGAMIIGLGNFILVPLYTRHLTPSEFGAYALIEVTLLVLVVVSQLGFGVSYLKWFSKVGVTGRGELLGSVIVIGGSAALLSGTALALTILSPIGYQLSQTGDRDFAWFLIPIVILENVQALFLTDLRAQRKPILFSISAVSRLFAIIIASLWFIVARDMGVKGIFLGRLVGDTISVLLLAIFCIPSVKLSVSSSVAIPMIRYGLPLIVSTIIAMMLDASGRYFLNLYGSMDQVGLYSVAVKIANIFQMLITQPFGIAWGGLMFQIVNWPNGRLVYSKILIYVFNISMTAALVLALFTPSLFKVFATAEYAPAMAVFPLILLVRAVNLMEYPNSIGIYLGEQTKWIPVIYLIGLGVNILTNLFLVPSYGMFGAALAWLFSWCTITVILLASGQRLYALHLNRTLLLFPILVWSIFLVLVINPEIIEEFNWLLSVSLSILILFSAAVILGYDFIASSNQTANSELHNSS